MALSWSMDKIGPICRTVGDCALVFNEILGADPLDSSSVDGPAVAALDDRPARRPLSRSIQGKRIGVLRDEFGAVSDPEATSIFRNALKSLRALGLVLEEVQLNDYPYQDIARYTMNVEAACVFEPLWKSGMIDLMLNKQRVLDWSAARLLPATDYLKMQRIRGEICDYAGTLFKRYAALVAPTSSTPAALVDVSDLPGANPIGIVATGGSLAFGNLAGLPALSVPCGFTSSNLPLGLQFIGAAFDESGILRIAHAYEQTNTWLEKHPQL
jgi:aspartyl-tRNA(Asn)/glutamyl-tRNA(Gln) amidotransferase subunit A